MRRGRALAGILALAALGSAATAAPYVRDAIAVRQVIRMLLGDDTGAGREAVVNLDPAATRFQRRELVEAIDESLGVADHNDAALDRLSSFLGELACHDPRGIPAWRRPGSFSDGLLVYALIRRGRLDLAMPEPRDVTFVRPAGLPWGEELMGEGPWGIPPLHVDCDGPVVVVDWSAEPCPLPPGETRTLAHTLPDGLDIRVEVTAVEVGPDRVRLRWRFLESRPHSHA
ncbi:MAG TPA: hypothetical protein VHF22_10605 [Planctomycetota bacterium]|nr:hypothetical protein [Planctomycetota bacterium]